MDKLSDYIQWLGGCPFSALKFREADALVLSLLSYVDFSPLFASGESEVRLSASLSMLDEGKAEALITGDTEEILSILRLAAESVRFGNLLLSNYLDMQREDPPLQFSAVCFHENDWSFLAYRGTDSSLAGWKEDFMISFTRTEAQQLAVEYAEKCITADRVWYMGGHSKGGNEVLYAACMLSREKWKNVERVFLLDGPGFCPEVIDPELIKQVDAKITRIIPEFSVIGMLFEPKISDTRIVKSTASVLLQHSLPSWGIDHGRLTHCEANDPTSIWLHEVLDRWIGGISQEERPMFIDELFEALSAGGTRSLNDFEKDGREKVNATLKALWNSSEVTKRVMSDLPKEAFKHSLEQMSKLGEITDFLKLRIGRERDADNSAKVVEI